MGISGHAGLSVRLIHQWNVGGKNPNVEWFDKWLYGVDSGPSGYNMGTGRIFS